MNPTLRIATCNIHKGVQSIGPQCQRAIHNLGQAVEQLDADMSERRSPIAEFDWPETHL